MKTHSAIQIENEPESNEIRKLAAELIPKGHKTYTPTQLWSRCRKQIGQVESLRNPASAV